MFYCTVVENQMFGLSISEIIAIMSCVVAISAFVVSFMQWHIMRKHNRLSVRPHLGVRKNIVPDESISIHIFNDGLGTAIIKSIAVEVQNKKIQLDSTKAFQDLFFGLGLHVPFDIIVLSEDSSISVGETKMIISFPELVDDLMKFQLLSNYIFEMKFIIKYESFYGVEYQYSDSKNLTIIST